MRKGKYFVSFCLCALLTVTCCLEMLELFLGGNKTKMETTNMENHNNFHMKTMNAVALLLTLAMLHQRIWNVNNSKR